MASPTQENQAPQENKPSDKELNFRALESKYQQQLAQERSERERLQQELQQRQQPQQQDDEDEAEPYVDHKRLNKKLAKFGEQTKQQTQAEIKQAVSQALQEERKSNWLKQNPDFYDVLQHAEKFAQKDPDLAESILEMPEGFERQKLVYKSIKSLGLHKAEVKPSSIQDKVDANRRSPYYQPSGTGTAPYATAGDFSAAGQKSAYAKMQELKSRIRI